LDDQSGAKFLVEVKALRPHLARSDDIVDDGSRIESLDSGGVQVKSLPTSSFFYKNNKL